SSGEQRKPASLREGPRAGSGLTHSAMMSPRSEGRSGLEATSVRSQAVAPMAGPASEMERLRSVLDSVPAALLYVDAEERYVFANRFYETHHFRPWLQIQGKTLREVMGDDAYARVRPHVRAALDGRTVTFETEQEREGAPTILVRYTYTPDLAPE